MKSYALLAALGSLVAAAPVDLSARASSGYWYAAMDHSLSDNYYSNVGGVVQSVIANNGSDFASACGRGRPDFTFGGDSGDKYLTGAPRVVYLPGGTYELTETQYLYTDTVIWGDPTDPPVIKLASGFSGDYLIVGGRDGTGNGGELHFSVEIKNVVLDTSSDSSVTALSWRVAQNCALSNVQINLPQGQGTGIYIGQGSTISVADVTINNGGLGVNYDGHQQAQFKGFTFKGTEKAYSLNGGNAITIIDNTFENVGVSCVSIDSPNGHVAVLDSQVSGSGPLVAVPPGDNGKLSLVVENIASDGASDFVNIKSQSVVPGAKSLGTYVYGNFAGKSYTTSNARVTDYKPVTNTRPSGLAPNGKYVYVSPQTYSDKTADDVINAKDTTSNGGLSIKGDNQNDDTAGLNSLFANAAKAGKVVFLPAGIYKVSDTVVIPPGSEVVGEAWSTISGTGDNFNDESNPKAVVAVGNPGDKGSAHIQDMRFTMGTEGAGAIILQLNMAGNNPGDVSVHNSLITLGGTDGTEINCTDEASCKAAQIGLHFNKGSSAYVENFWSWVADHTADGASVSPFSAGKYGVVIEATDPTWIMGLGSEHWWNAQVFWNEAENVVLSFFQSETNYRQNNGASVDPPAPWTTSGNDPTFSWCNGDSACTMGANEYWTGGKNLYHYAAGAYNFNNAEQGNMFVVQGTVPSNFQLYGTTTHAASNNLLVGSSSWGTESGVYAGAWGSEIAAYLDNASTTPA